MVGGLSRIKRSRPWMAVITPHAVQIRDSVVYFGSALYRLRGDVVSPAAASSLPHWRVDYFDTGGKGFVLGLWRYEASRSYEDYRFAWRAVLRLMIETGGPLLTCCAGPSATRSIDILTGVAQTRRIDWVICANRERASSSSLPHYRRH